MSIFGQSIRPLILLAAIVALAPVARAQPASQPDPAQQLQQQRDVLFTSPAPVQREDAARRLLRLNSTEARNTLREALWDTSNPRAQVAAARALVSDTEADAAMVDPLSALMGSPDDARTDAAAQALANYAQNGLKAAWDRLSAQAANVIKKNRAIVLRAMARLTDQQAAATLVAQMSNLNNDVSVRNAAADAFVEMTGLYNLRRDFARIDRWWNQIGKAMPADDWRRGLNERKAARTQELAESLRRLVDENREVLTPVYEALADEPKRTPVLMKLLNSSSEHLRLLGAEFARIDKDFNRVIARDAAARLRGMIADSSPEVREAAARTLAKLNDAGAVEAMIAQLGQEPASEVRSAIAEGLGPMRDLKAVDTLIGALDDESGRVAEAAAGSLRPLAQRAAESKDEPAIAKLAEALRKKLRSAQASQGAVLRDRIVAAMAPLGEKSLLQTYLQLLGPAETPAVRKAAIEGIEQIGDPNSANAVSRHVDPRREPVATVRLAAVKAMARVGGFEDMESVEQALADSDASVADEAWRTISKLAEKGDADQVKLLADRLSTRHRLPPDRRATLLQIAEKKLLAGNRLAELASIRQLLGDALMKADKPQLARKPIEQALEYWVSVKEPGKIRDPIIFELLQCLLQGGADDDAAKLCSEWMGNKVELTGDLWRNVEAEIGARREKKQYARAAELIDKMGTVAGFRNYAARIKDLKELIEREQKNGGLFWWPHRTRFATTQQPDSDEYAMNSFLATL